MASRARVCRPRSASTYYACYKQLNVRFGSLADIGDGIRDVRFASESGHDQLQDRCLLCAISGHWARENFANQIANQLRGTERYQAIQGRIVEAKLAYQCTRLAAGRHG